MGTLESELRAHDVERRCDHKMIDSVACAKCGWTPPKDDLLAQMLVTWERMTHDEHLSFLKRVTIR